MFIILRLFKNFFFWKEGWWWRKLALPSEEICNSTKILLFNADLNLGCLHLLVLITELHFWSIDNQYSCCSKTSEFYKINLWLELAPWKAESWYHVGEVLVLETRKKFHGSGIWNLFFCGVHQIHSTLLQAWILSFFFFPPSLNVQETTKEKSLNQSFLRCPF